MRIHSVLGANRGVTRRALLRLLTGLAGVAWIPGPFRFDKGAWAQSVASGLPLPDEPVQATLKRLFGNRPLQSGEGKIKLDLPLIAEDGGNVALAVEANLPVSGASHVNHLYILSDKNRLPLLVKFSFTPESGKVFVATNIRLATTTDVRVVAEMNDGTLYAVSRHVRVTISGCDVPPPA